MLKEDQVREIRSAFDEAIAPFTGSWLFNEYGLQLNSDEVMGAIKVLDAILENPHKYDPVAGVFMVRKEEKEDQEADGDANGL